MSCEMGGWGLKQIYMNSGLGGLGGLVVPGEMGELGEL